MFAGARDFRKAEDEPWSEGRFGTLLSLTAVLIATLPAVRRQWLDDASWLGKVVPRYRELPAWFSRPFNVVDACALGLVILSLLRLALGLTIAGFGEAQAGGFSRRNRAEKR